MSAHDHADHPDIRVAREEVLNRIAEACARVGRSPDEVTLVAVTKEVEPERVAEAVAAGLTTLGENRVQEAESKVGQVAGGTWHLVGPLQSNKARRAIAVFDTIETVDSHALARRLDRIVAEDRAGRTLPILLEVNIDRDPAKAGYALDLLAADLDSLLELQGLDIQGLMTVGRQVSRAEDARPTFAALARLSEQLRTHHPGLGMQLSMGMTDDFEVAVEEGATIVRVGRALFGERHHH
jgi:pyridoxal phosphate enzyme (YggS family)